MTAYEIISEFSNIPTEEEYNKLVVLLDKLYKAKMISREYIKLNEEN